MILQEEIIDKIGLGPSMKNIIFLEIGNHFKKKNIEKENYITN